MTTTPKTMTAQDAKTMSDDALVHMNKADPGKWIALILDGAATQAQQGYYTSQLFYGNHCEPKIASSDLRNPSKKVVAAIIAALQLLGYAVREMHARHLATTPRKDRLPYGLELRWDGKEFNENDGQDIE